MPTAEKTVFDRVTTYGRKPRTGMQALRQARDLLAEEGRWCTGAMFSDGNPEDVFEDKAACGSWNACAVGAIGLVTGDFQVSIRKEWEDAHPTDFEDDWRDAVSNYDTDLGLKDWFSANRADEEVEAYYEWDADFVPSEGTLTWDACELVSHVINEEHDGKFAGSTPVDAVIQFNDEFANREEVLEAFDKAIKLGQSRAQRRTK